MQSQSLVPFHLCALPSQYPKFFPKASQDDAVEDMRKRKMTKETQTIFSTSDLILSNL